jgi:hypothetical protein
MGKQRAANANIALLRWAQRHRIPMRARNAIDADLISRAFGHRLPLSISASRTNIRHTVR